MIPQIKTILYVSDIEDGSRPAFRMAVSLAKQYDAKIIFLHVIAPMPDSVRVTLESTLSAPQYRKIRQDGLMHLRETIGQRIDNFCTSELASMEWHPHVESLLLEGSVHQIIVEAAKIKSAELIVMGTRTHSATKQFFMGSTANKVMHHSDIPVLVVPLH
ncbi:MAG: universal stress protein [Gammaproteobacteria bacterium]|nr:universal stress protein [Gammaproteobacteria bacterium]